ncbi:hypothetical protein GcC1_031030 [Golovinomyces cichoracearum]|uniref:Uncharacterized protein n=1 Tax=Golovinomyces cichoracearum TaxID=62708 RepID=A0A420J2F9_9PEZI|nr:hypothetical protein GcC1_031030 [Golovinomyces cichoracearum]
MSVNDQKLIYLAFLMIYSKYIKKWVIQQKITIQGINKCLTCKEEGFWSTKHWKKERDEAFNKIKSKTKNKIDRNFLWYCQKIEEIPPKDRNMADSDLEKNSDENIKYIENFIFDTALLSVDQIEE